MMHCNRTDLPYRSVVKIGSVSISYNLKMVFQYNDVGLKNKILLHFRDIQYILL